MSGQQAGLIIIYAGIGAVVLGVVEMFRSNNFSNVIGLIIMMALAVLSIQAAGHFHKVASTDEADQDHIVGGFRKLRLAYLLLSIWIIIGLVFLCAVLLFAIIAGIVMAARLAFPLRICRSTGTTMDSAAQFATLNSGFCWLLSWPH